ncbi:MAG: hypothetical protein V2A78_09640 [bacterium]
MADEYTSGMGIIEGFKKLFGIEEPQKKDSSSSSCKITVTEGVSLAYKSLPELSMEFKAIEISSLLDEETCPYCQYMDGMVFPLESAYFETIKENRPPFHNCSCPHGCRCLWIYISKEEQGAGFTGLVWRKPSDELIKTGQLSAEDTQFKKRIEEEIKKPVIRENIKMGYLASEKAQEAIRIEKENPEKAILLYQESIRIQREIAEKFPDPWCWRDFPWLYNRLTLVLERLKNYQEALNEIKRYKSLPCKDAGAKSDREAILKREERLQQKSGK